MIQGWGHRACDKPWAAQGFGVYAFYAAFCQATDHRLEEAGRPWFGHGGRECLMFGKGAGVFSTCFVCV